MRKSWSKAFLSLLLLLFVVACGAPQPQQTLTPTEQATATWLVEEIADKSFVGQWGSGNRVVDVQINPRKNFVFHLSGGGQFIEIVRDRGAGPYSATFKVVSMRLGSDNSLSIVVPGDDSVTYTFSFWRSTDGSIKGNASVWSPSSGTWEAPLTEGKIPE